MVKYLDRNCTEQEIVQLLECFDQPQNESTLKGAIMKYLEEEAERGQFDAIKETKALNDVHAKLMESIGVKRTKIKYIQWLKISAAASILALMSLGIYSYFITSDSQKDIVKVQKQDVEPGGSKGILTLSDGVEISLENTKVETLAHQGNTTIRNKNGQLVYISESPKVENIFYNRVTIPRGGQYQLVLPDGTKVWLNAASTIAFPTAFTGKERRVRITGEVYFEVAPLDVAAENGIKEKMPFIVNVDNKAEVKVLGTHFNVNSYSDEDGSIKTTLLEGSVEVLSVETNQKYIIKPGQQAAIIEGGSLNVKEVNTEEVIAWKNGFFYFDNTSLQNIMQQLSRWYDVKVTYEGDVPERIFSGKIHRDVNLSEVLEILKFTKVNFRIEDKCIIVTP